jgi:hypothetical protein
LIMTLHFLETERNAEALSDAVHSLTWAYLGVVGDMVDALSCSMILLGLSRTTLSEHSNTEELLDKLAEIVINKHEQGAFFAEDLDNSNANTIVGIIASLETLRYKNDEFLNVFLSKLAQVPV